MRESPPPPPLADVRHRCEMSEGLFTVMPTFPPSSHGRNCVWLYMWSSALRVLSRSARIPPFALRIGRCSVCLSNGFVFDNLRPLSMFLLCSLLSLATHRVSPGFFTLLELCCRILDLFMSRFIALRVLSISATFSGCFYFILALPRVRVVVNSPGA